MYVSNELKQRVFEKLQQSIDRAHEYYDHKYTFEFPTVRFTLTGTTAGTANSNRNVIDLNSTLLVENENAFINRTVPHELAHLIDAIVNPETRDTKFSFGSGGRYRRTKRSIHGPTWKRIMVMLGCDPLRCHSYDVSSVASPKKTFTYHCKCGNSVMNLSVKRHNKMFKGPKVDGFFTNGYYKHHHTPNRCGGYKFIGVNDPVFDMPVAAQKPTDNTAQKPKSQKPKSQSKIDMCRNIFTDSPNAPRQEMIALFQSQAQCTPAGAATYYATLNRKTTH
jgi:SprT protein